MGTNVTVKAVYAFHDSNPDHVIPERVTTEVHRRHRQIVSAGMATAGDQVEIMAVPWEGAEEIAADNPLLTLGLSVLDELTTDGRAFGHVDGTQIVVMDIPLSALARGTLAAMMLVPENLIAWSKDEKTERNGYEGLTVIVRQLKVKSPADAVLVEDHLSTTWNYIGPFGNLIDYKYLEGSE